MSCRVLFSLFVRHFSHIDFRPCWLGGSEFSFADSKVQFETFLSFPSPTSNNTNHVHVFSNIAPVLLNGTIDEIIIDPVPSRAQVAIASPDRLGYVHVEDDGVSAPAFNYEMSGTCLNSLPFVAGRVIPTQWMCLMMRSNSFQECADCSVHYVGKLHFTIRTGAQRDVFRATDVTVPVSLALGDAADEVEVKGEKMAVDLGLPPIYEMDVGSGSDKVTVWLPSNGMRLRLGEDIDPDSLYFFYPSQVGLSSPQVQDTQVLPIGTRETSIGNIEQLYSEDAVRVRRMGDHSSSLKASSSPLPFTTALPFSSQRDSRAPCAYVPGVDKVWNLTKSVCCHCTLK